VAGSKPDTTAVVVATTALQKQQVVAAFTVSGTFERARPLIATLWGVEEAALPADAELREYVGDTSIVPEKEQTLLAERYAQAMHRAKLLNFDEAVIDAGIALVREGSPKFFQIMGAHKLIGQRVDPMVSQKTTIYDMRGAQFKTSRPRGKTVGGETVIEGEFTEVDTEGD
jgi:hypothetical protein